MTGSDEAQQHSCSRRSFIRLAAFGAAVSTVGKLVGQSNLDDGFIDAHVHVWTPNVRKYPLAKDWTPADMKPASFTPDQLMAHCRPLGVTRIVLIQMSFYGFENAYMLDTMRQNPGVYSGVAVIDENDAPSRVMKQLAERGVRGFRIRPKDRQPNRWLTGEGMQEMWRCGAAEGLAMCHLIDPNYLPSVNRMCRRHPDTPVVIDHFGRIGIDGIIRSQDLQNLCALAKHRNVFVKTSAFYALGKKQPPYMDLSDMIRRVLDAFGPERLMWASDCPFQVEGIHSYQASIDLIRSGVQFLSANDRQWLLRRTAERVFFS